MPTYSIKLDHEKMSVISAEPPVTLPVLYNDRKIALAVFEQEGYSFRLPQSLSYLVQLGCAVPTLFYPGPNGLASETSYDGTEPESIVLIQRPQLPQPGGRIKVRAHAHHI
jgi:hypothetical protein